MNNFSQVGAYKRRPGCIPASAVGFCHRVCAEADNNKMIVAVARKMPRLLEYCGVIDGSQVIISERALPWIFGKHRSAGELHFIDDILNVGTTLSHYTEYAHDVGHCSNIEVSVYGRRKKNVGLHDKSPMGKYASKITWDLTFDNSEYNLFETRLPIELLTLGKPYDLDFPVISLSTDLGHSSSAPEDWITLLSQLFPSVHNLTLSSQREEGIVSISVIEPLDFGVDDILPSEALLQSPPAKIRLYISTKSNCINVVPMLIPSVTQWFLEQFPWSSIGGFLGGMVGKLDAKPAEGRPFRLEPVYNLLVYLSSFYYASLFIPHLIRLFSSAEIVGVDAHDLRLSFGTDVGNRLGPMLNNYLNSCDSEVGLRHSFPKYKLPKQPEEADLCSDIVKELKKQGYSNRHPQPVLREIMLILDKIYRANDPEPKEDYPDYRRLRHGLVLSDLWWIVSKISPDRGVDLEEISFLLDYDVDTGVMVPVVSEQEGRYFRCYRRGEASPTEFAQFINKMLHEHTNLFPENRLQTTHFTKILATMAVSHPGKMPLLPVFKLRGNVPYVISTEKTESIFEDAIGFLFRKGYIVFEKPTPKMPLFEEE